MDLVDLSNGESCWVETLPKPQQTLLQIVFQEIKVRTPVFHWKLDLLPLGWDMCSEQMIVQKLDGKVRRESELLATVVEVEPILM